VGITTIKIRKEKKVWNKEYPDELLSMAGEK
jgi:hypothetical protein